VFVRVHPWLQCLFFRVVAGEKRVNCGLDKGAFSCMVVLYV
jgi:hypothetical protein